MRQFLSFVYPKRLPQGFGGGSLLVSPRADSRVLRPGWEKCARDLMIVAEKNVKPGMTVWDVGSNLGIFAALASGKAGPEGRVFAVEPDPYYANLIGRSAKRLKGGYAPIGVLCAAVADRVGVADFAEAEQGHARSALAAHARTAAAATRPVPVLTLDDLLDAWPAPDVVKIDVEGAEIAALAGATRLLAEARPVIYIEVGAENTAAAYEMFSAAGYETFQLNSGDERLTDAPGMYTMARPAPPPS